VDIENGLLPFRDTKGKVDRAVPMGDVLRAMFQSKRRGGPDDYGG
jgi:hypothetical protein